MIDRDTSLSIETAWYHQGDGDFQYTVYRNTEEIVKLKRSIFVGPEELHQTIYFPNRATPLYFHRQTVMYFDDLSQRISEEASYYVDGELLPPLNRVIKFPTSTHARVSDVPWLPQLERMPIVSEDNKIFVKKILEEIQSKEFVPAKLYTGRYLSAYDRESFVDCHTGCEYQIEDRTLRDMYAELGLELSVRSQATFVATMDLQEEVTGEMVETLTLVEFVSMQKEKACE